MLTMQSQGTPTRSDIHLTKTNTNQPSSLFESVLSNRKQHLINLPTFNVTKVKEKDPNPNVPPPQVSLYERGMKRKEYQSEWLKRQGEARDDRIAKECTFNPSLGG